MDSCERPWTRLRTLLTALHRRDESLGFLPAVDKGPPRGLIDAAVRSARFDEPMPDLRQLPPNLDYAARAAHYFATTMGDPGLVDRWLDRNLAALETELSPEAVGKLPLEGCRTEEDVRNRVLVNLAVMALRRHDMAPVIGEVAELDVRLVG